VLREQHTKEVEKILKRYPDKRSAMIPLLWLVQHTAGYVTAEGMAEVAEIIGVTLAQVQEAVTFYTMFHQKPVGKYLISVCNNISCSLLGADHLVEHVEARLGIATGETTADGRFTLQTVECLGACTMAPVMMINEILYPNLTPEKIDQILKNCT
jgi:NADH-quinone oxidoreductase E subunit